MEGTGRVGGKTIMVTGAAMELHARGGGLGVATACMGVGRGLAVVLEA
jgi:acetyl-CoA acetyltransferase